MSQIEGRRHDFVRSGRNNDHVFRAAMRHSRVVRVLRIGIPLGVVLSVAVTIAAMTWLDPLSALAKLPVSSDGLVVSGSKITMQQPRLVGFTRDSRPYSVTARSAAQDITKPDTIELRDIRAIMTARDQSKIDVVAKDGIYDGKTEILTLHDNVVVTTPTYIVRLKQAVVGVKTGNVVSEHPVEVKMPQGTINANRLEVENSGEVLRFDGGVDMVIDGDSVRQEAAAGTP
ncbi:MAG: LPS export ABC transporter periplasmic protein LptC [Xanthobacteraceae bacterium]